MTMTMKSSGVSMGKNPWVKTLTFNFLPTLKGDI